MSATERRRPSGETLPSIALLPRTAMPWSSHPRGAKTGDRITVRSGSRMSG